MLRHTHLLFVALCASVILSATGAFAVERTSQLISNDLLEHAGLKSAWQINLPIKEKENLDRMYIDGKLLYVLTDRNYLFCIDRLKGRQRFSLQLAMPGIPVHKPTFYKGKAQFTVGNKYIVLDPDLGYITESEQLSLVGRNTACPAVRNEGALYVAGTNTRLHVLDIDDYFLYFMVSADNNSQINSLMVTDEYAIFSTVTGNIVKIPARKKEPMWQSEIADGLSADVVEDSGELYVSSLDMKLYKISARSALEMWESPFQTGQPLDTSARIGKDVIYQYAGKAGVYAIDRKTGEQIWNNPKGFDLLAEQDTRAYLIGNPSTIIVMDNAKKKLLYSINAAGVTNYAVNNEDSKIYIAGKKGRLLSIEIANPKFEVK